MATKKKANDQLNVADKILGSFVIATVIFSVGWLVIVSFDKSVKDFEQAYLLQQEQVAKVRYLIITNKEEIKDLTSEIGEIRDWVVDLENNQIRLQTAISEN